MKYRFLFLLCVISSLLKAWSSSPSIENRNFFVDQKFNIYSQVQLPWEQENFNFDTFQWTDQDHWQLVYCPNSIELVSESSIAPDGMGGNLLQHWTLLPHKKGDYILIFKRLGQKRIIHIVVKK